MFLNIYGILNKDKGDSTMKSLLLKEDTDFVRDNLLFNYCVWDDNALLIESFIKNNQITIDFNVNQFYFCITGLDKRYTPYNEPLSFNTGVDNCLRLYQLFNTIMKDNGYVGNSFLIKVDNSKQLALIFSKTEHCKCSPIEFAQKIHQCCFMEHKEILAYRDLFTTSISECFQGYEGIHQSYLQARKYNNLSFFQFDIEVLHKQLIDSMQIDCGLIALDENCRKLRNLLCTQSIKAVCNQIDYLFNDLVKHSMNYQYYGIAAAYMETTLLLFSQVYHLSLPIHKGSDFNILTEYNDYLKKTIDQLMIQKKGLPVYTFEILQTLNFIQIHSHKDLSLTLIADYTNINPSYLSSEFNKQVGISLPEYISMQRIEKAKLLLQNNRMKLAEIANAVGISNPKYFSELFKKHTHCSPSEYRKMALNQN